MVSIDDRLDRVAERIGEDAVERMRDAGAPLLDPHELDAAIVGATDSGAVVYDRETLVDIMVKTEECTREDAHEWLGYNSERAAELMFDEDVRPIIKDRDE